MLMAQQGTVPYGRMAYLGIAGLLIVQTAHMAEHVAQVIQKFVLHMAQAHGLLGSIFDLEWVHFIYNTSLWIPLVLVLQWYRKTGAPMPTSMRLVVWLQGYHVIEHIVKMYQYYALGITVGPKGILGFVFPLIWLHFWLNLTVLLLIVASFFGIRAGYRRFAPAMA